MCSGMSSGLFEAAVTVDDGTGARDLLIRLPTSADQPATGADLYGLLRRAAGRELPLLTLERTGELLARNASLVNTGLVSGDRLTAVAPRPGTSPKSEPVGDTERIILRTLTGPQPGAELAVLPGVSVGRSTSDALDDASVSRQQFRFNIADGSVSLEDRGGVNPTVVNGRTASPRVPTEVTPGDVIEAGNVAMSLVSGPPVRRDIHNQSFAYRDGALGFLQAPRVIDPEPEPVGDPPAPPNPPPERRFPLAAALLPVGLGLILAAVLGPRYALFVLISPLMVVWTYLDDRRSGRRSHAREVASHQQQVAVHRLAVADHNDQLAAWRRRRTPSITQINRWVRVGAPELWSRRPDHDDFLTVAVGQVDRPATGADAQAVGAGAAELRATASTLDAEVPGHLEPQLERSAPVTLDIGDNPVVGVTGEPRAAAGVAAAIVAQLVGLRSPRDLKVFVLAPAFEDTWSWVKWLPHARAMDGGPTRSLNVAGTDAEAETLFRQLQATLLARRDADDRRFGSGANHPHTVVVVQPPVGIAPAALSGFLSDAGRHGFSVVMLAADRSRLPAEVDVHLEAGDLVNGLEKTTFATSDVERQIRPWFLDPVRADALARDLAPLVDLNADVGGSVVPAVARFQETMGLTLPGTTAVIDPPPVNTVTPDMLVDRWTGGRTGLQSIIGSAEGGPVALDLKADGPHALVAGTTGSGKSEFLRALLAGLAFNYSPADVNFILVDYKGGAAFRQCRLLPHTVGFVTDLDDRLAERALISLRAELRRREELLATAGVSDLVEMAAAYRGGPDEQRVPASLVVVIDEFAALKSEVPDFVDGLVDIAQRGRSMGVHMILATQKPAGVVTPQIDANTNIRVALRVANEHESSDIIGSPVAAEITSEAPGRAYLKIGGGSEITEFQSTFVGGPVRNDASTTASVFSVEYRSSATVVALADVVEETQSSDRARLAGDDGPIDSELEVLVALAGAAWAKLGGDFGAASDQSQTTVYGAHEVGRPLHRPWLPPLPDVVALPDLLFVDPASKRRDNGRAPSSHRFGDVAIGLLDVPNRQSQVPMLLDLEAAGHVAVYGTSGSGKSTLLRAIACSVTARSADARMPGPEVVVVDSAGSVTDLADLPLVGDVIAADDGERVALLMERLRSAVTGGRRDDNNESLLVLIDGFGAFWSTLQSMEFGRPADEFARLLSDMPGSGVHVVMTADQRSAIPRQCLASVGIRLVQRMTSADDYRALDVRTPPSTAGMPPGRTLVVGLGDDVVEMQTAVPVLSRANGEGSVGVAEQVDAVSLLAADSERMLRSAGIAARKPVLLGLPDVVGIDDPALGLTTGLHAVAVGLGRGRRPVTVNFVDNATLLVVGPPRSGRTSTLLTLLRQSGGGQLEQRVVAPRRSSELAEWPCAVTAEFASTMQAWSEERSARTEDLLNGCDVDPLLIVIDDADSLFEDTAASGPLTDLILNGRDGAITVVAAAASFRTAQAYDTWVRALRSAGHGLVLQPDGDRDEDIFDCRFPRGLPTLFSPGRGYLIERAAVQLVQVALPTVTAAGGHSEVT